MTTQPGPKWWSEGRDEVTRRIHLALYHFHLWQERRHVARAETELGTLGWQQADFFSPEIQEQVDRIIDFEKNQAALYNREANLSWEKSEKESERKKASALAGEEMARLREERRAIAATRGERQAALMERSRETNALRQQLRELQSNIEQLQILRTKLRTFNTIEARQELSRVAMQLEPLTRREKEMLPKVETEAALELDACNELAELDGQISKLDEALEQRRTALEAETTHLDTDIVGIESEQKRMREMSEALEHEKTSPYRLIGQCLADHNIGSMNQPKALPAVLGARQAVADLEGQIAATLEACASADRVAILQFYLIAGFACFILLLFLAWVF